MKSSKRWKKTLDEYKRTENCNKNNILWIERWLKYNDKEEEAGAQSYSIAVLLVREKKNQATDTEGHGLSKTPRVFGRLLNLTTH